MLLKISHKTSYNYDAPVDYALQQARLTPKSRAGQSVLNWKIKLDGARQELDFNDENNNLVTLLSIEPGQSQFEVLCEGEVEVIDNAGVVGMHGGYAPLWYFLRATPLTKIGSKTKQLIKTLGTEFESDTGKFHALSNLIAEKVQYQTGSTNVTTTAEDALENGSGVCQDHAHIFVAAARALGYPARYVSGYLMMNDRVDQEATHAWAEVHLQDLGWVGFDVSNGISPDDRYIRVATGLDYKEAAPVSGLRFGNSSESMIVSVQVQQ